MNQFSYKLNLAKWRNVAVKNNNVFQMNEWRKDWFVRKGSTLNNKMFINWIYYLSLPYLWLGIQNANPNGKYSILSKYEKIPRQESRQGKRYGKIISWSDKFSFVIHWIFNASTSLNLFYRTHTHTHAFILLCFVVCNWNYSTSPERNIKSRIGWKWI